MSSSRYVLTLGFIVSSFVIGCGSDGKETSNKDGSGGSTTGRGGSSTTAGSESHGGRTSSGGSQNKGGNGNPSGGSGGSTTGNDEECAKLDACCATVTNSTLRAAACGTAAHLDCSLEYAVLRAQGECADDPGSELPDVELDGTWGPAQELGVLAWQGQELSISTPVVEPCGKGDAIAAWYQNGGTVGEVGLARYSAATSAWQVFPRIDQNSGLQPGRPYLAANSKCEALIVWNERLPILGATHDRFTLKGATYDAAATVSAPFVVQAEGDAEATEVELSLAADGTGLLTYKDVAVVRRTFTPGTGFGDSMPLSAQSINAWGFDSVEDGTALQVYTERETETGVAIATSFQIHSDEWSAPKTLLPNDELPSDLHVVAAGDRFYVSYAPQTGSGLGLVSVKADGTVGVPEVVDGVEPGALFSANGDAQIIAWRKDQKLVVMERSGSGAWSTPKSISAESHQVYAYALGIDAQGRAMAVYSSSKYAAFANRRDADGVWLGVHALNGVGSEPSLAVDADGNFFAAYYGSHGGLANPQLSSYAQVFKPSTK